MRPPHPNPLASREILLLCARENNLAIVSRKRMKPTQSVLQTQKLGRGTGGRIVLTGKIFREAMRHERLTEWRKAVANLRQEAEQRGNDWQIDVDFFSVVLEILDGK